MISSSWRYLSGTISYRIYRICISTIMRSKCCLKSTERRCQRPVRAYTVTSCFLCANGVFFGIGGYINEHGKINLPRLQIFLDALSTFEQEAYEKEHSDMNWFKSKQRPKELAQLEEKGIKGAFSMFPSLSLRIFFLFMA